jgi:hypothetical protein
MTKFSIDYAGLENRVYKKAYKLSDVKDRIETVAFDIVRFRDSDDSANLWQVQSADDGDYIVAMYQADEEKTAASWGVTVSKLAGDLHISYKGDPIVKVNFSKLGIPRSELSKIEEYLPAKLTNNKKLVTALLNELTGSAKKEVLNKYPELV